MTRFEQNAAETAETLGIPMKDAIALELFAMKAWAHLAGNTKAEALFHVAAKHATGELSGADYRACMNVIG